MLPALEMAIVDRSWEWNDGKGLPKNFRWGSLTKAQQKDIHEGNTSLTLLPDNRTFQKVAEYDLGVMVFQSEGMWIRDRWSYVRALIRPIGPDLVLAVHADHKPAEQTLKCMAELSVDIYTLVCIHIYLRKTHRNIDSVSIYIYIYRYICTYLCIYILVYIHIYKCIETKN